ncbi:Tll0287-like domain-containing protein [Methylomonas sp. MgM2]
MKTMIAKSLAIAMLCPASLCYAQNGGTAEQQAYLQESRQIAKAFTRSLGSTLKAQLESGDAVSAIGVCKYVAPALAADYSNESLTVARVSLKNRNPVLGKPDLWETQVLQRFDREHTEAKPANTMEISEMTEEADGRWFRYMKAIPTQPMCLQCHGQTGDISPEVKTLLAEEYPDDRATGYRVGDIRGAVSIKHKLADAIK